MRWFGGTVRGHPRPEIRESRLSLLFLLRPIAAPFVGFALAGDQAFYLGAHGDWEVSKAAVRGVFATAVGVYFGPRRLEAVRQQAGRTRRQYGVGRAFATGMPIFEALTNPATSSEGGRRGRRMAAVRQMRTTAGPS